jgi:hypothetical protein
MLMTENPAGRPRKYASDAERQAAHRAKWAVRTFSMVPDKARTIAELSTTLDVSESAVVHALCSFALANRNWALTGLTGFVPAGLFPQGKRRPSKILQSAKQTEDE